LLLLREGIGCLLRRELLLLLGLIIKELRLLLVWLEIATVRTSILILVRNKNIVCGIGVVTVCVVLIHFLISI